MITDGPYYRSCGNEAEIIKDRLYFVTLRKKPRSSPAVHYFSTDDEFVYNRFYEDFGPLNLAMVYRYCCRLNRKLKAAKMCSRKVVHYVADDAKKRVNAAFLIGAYTIIYLKMTPDDAYLPLISCSRAPFLPFRDATCGPSTYSLLLLDCLHGIHKALVNGFLNFRNFDVLEYEHYEKVENGDLNWIVPNKFIAFCGPHAQCKIEDGYVSHTPEMYLSYFLSHNVTDVIRLNNKVYSATRFTNAGIAHHDLYFIDGSVPTDDILARFLHISEKAAGAVAVHCKAGLGRTGTLIGCYLMKHYEMTAAETIAWIRIARPGSILGPQQNYMEQKQTSLWAAGRQYRQRVSDTAGKPQTERCLVTIVNSLSLDDNQNCENSPVAIDDVDNMDAEMAASTGTKTQTQGDLLNQQKLLRLTEQRQRRTPVTRPRKRKCPAAASEKRISSAVVSGRVTRSSARH